uniref:Large ribosomal subunit protein uL6 N-terminal domain-containing protein n=1 Tax=Ananas comosus var. bracteatus TaxID=296719 RepID=A0A6V7P3W5_ANACO|nr:unnamed protein product [Ananas comosus var. bracteatus]
MAPKKARVGSRNPSLARGIGKFSRSKMYHKRGIWAIKAKHGGVFPATSPRRRRPRRRRRSPPSSTPPTTLRSPSPTAASPSPPSLGRLPSGLLLVTGPFKVNGVPLRRVNQAYVIGTSTKVDISGVNVEKFDDKYFAKEKKTKTKKTEGEFFETEKEETKSLPQEKKDDQKVVDSQLIKAIESVPDLKAYLSARFSLRSGMKPHELAF